MMSELQCTRRTNRHESTQPCVAHVETAPDQRGDVRREKNVTEQEASACNFKAYVCSYTICAWLPTQRWYGRPGLLGAHPLRISEDFDHLFDHRISLIVAPHQPHAPWDVQSFNRPRHDARRRSTAQRPRTDRPPIAPCNYGPQYASAIVLAADFRSQAELPQLANDEIVCVRRK